jgi:hypothetical protein
MGSTISAMSRADCSRSAGLEDGAHLVDRLGHLLEVAVDEQVGQPVADDLLGAVVEAAHDAEVEEHDVAVGVDHEVAGVDVTVEEAVLEGRLHPRPNPPLERLGEIPLPLGQLGQVVDLVAVDPLHGQHPGRGQRPVDGRHAHALVGAEGSQVLFEPLHRPPLGDEVQLLGERGGEVLHDGDRVGHPAAGGGVLQEASDHHEDVEVSLQPGPDPGPLDLHHDVVAVAGAGGVHLGDRGGGQRLVVEPLEKLLRRGTELLEDDLPGGGGGDGRDAIEEAAQLVGEGGREQPRAGGDELGELHVGRTQVAERVACLARGKESPLRRPALARKADRVPGQHACGPRRPAHVPRPEPADLVGLEAFGGGHVGLPIAVEDDLGCDIVTVLCCRCSIGREAATWP